MDNIKYQYGFPPKENDDLFEEDAEDYSYFEENGKVEINNLIWKLAPGKMTLDEAEAMAIHIYSLLFDKWEKYK